LRSQEDKIKTSEKAVGPTILVHFQSVGIIFLTEYLLSIGWCDLWHGVGTLKGFIFIFIVVSKQAHVFAHDVVTSSGISYARHLLDCQIQSSFDGVGRVRSKR
jgi:hypothetical protein